MKIIRIFFVALMAFTVFAWVMQEDVRETDETFSRCEMLQGAQQLTLNQRTSSVIRTSSLIRRYKNIDLASAEVSTPHLTMLSLASCILRC